MSKRSLVQALKSTTVQYLHHTVTVAVTRAHRLERTPTSSRNATPPPLLDAPNNMESLRYLGSLTGHKGWVTAIATSSENPDMILTASRGT